MKQTLLLCACCLYIIGGCAQTVGIDSILHYVEAHNPQLRAGRSQADTQKQLNRAGNNLPDPTISYSHLWAEKGSGESIGELIVSQQFDFPTLYAARSNVNRLKADALDADYDLLRQQILLQARELCIDLLRLQQQEVLLSERLKQTEALERLYQKRLANGDANILEVNKLNLELLNARTELQTYRIEWKNARIALLALCDQGNLSEQPSQAWQIADETLPTLPADSLGLLERLYEGSPLIRSLNAQNQAAGKQMSVDRQGWIPKLELGYRRNTESGVGFNGVVVGFSLPLFSNRHHVRASRAQLTNSKYLKRAADVQLRSELAQRYAEARSLQSTIQAYRNALQGTRNIDLLRRALEGGEINITDYFVESAVVYQSQLNLLNLESRYRKALANLYKNSL